MEQGAFTVNGIEKLDCLLVINRHQALHLVAYRETFGWRVELDLAVKEQIQLSEVVRPELELFFLDRDEPNLLLLVLV